MMNRVVIDTVKLDKIVKNLDKNRDDILLALAFDVEGKAKQIVPVDTGALRSSIYVEAKKSSNWNGSGERHPTPVGNIVANVGPSMEYAAYVELGTYRMGARPYLMPGVEWAINRINSESIWQPMFEADDMTAGAVQSMSYEGEFMGE